jgi:hypothetical protein
MNILPAGPADPLHARRLLCAPAHVPAALPAAPRQTRPALARSAGISPEPGAAGPAGARTLAVLAAPPLDPVASPAPVLHGGFLGHRGLSLPQGVSNRVSKDGPAAIGAPGEARTLPGSVRTLIYPRVEPAAPAARALIGKNTSVCDGSLRVPTAPRPANPLGVAP